MALWLLAYAIKSYHIISNSVYSLSGSLSEPWAEELDWAQAESLSDRFVHLHEMVKHDAEALSSLLQHVHTYLYPTGASSPREPVP